MLKITNTNTRTESVADLTNKITEHSVTGSVQLAGDSIWGYTGPSTVEVSAVHVRTNEDGYMYVGVTHNTTWDIYTDSAFEEAISSVVGESVTFTEQGMQDDNYATLEA